jgi:hypothetical protein
MSLRRRQRRTDDHKTLLQSCDEPGGITTRKFAGGIDVTVAQQEQSPTHACEACLAELMLEAVISLEDTPTTRDYLETKQKASDCSRAYAMVERTTAERDEIKERLQEARSETTTAARYDGWLKERAELLEKIEALEAARDVALTRAANAEQNSAEVVRKAAAAQVQGAVDAKDEGYVASVAAREAKRASGR